MNRKEQKQDFGKSILDSPYKNLNTGFMNVMVIANLHFRQLSTI